ncbi:hypothetical protein Z043_118247 [Scleropages formosus]|uniref:Uncharacterized protein n=1 Tax=Scleropages formosus TaxID=113540 RepID=A0A0N8JXE3_SCLFO|nr:hypothetical protein Z043_118247 [Scleropages formosus]
MKMVNSDKNGFSFKKCSAFQFVKRKVRRWIRNPKVNMEKGQRAGFLYPKPTCPLEQQLWCPQAPPYGCCHGYCPQDEPPCTVDKSKSCKVRKWKMLNRHHGDAKQKAACQEQEVEEHAICPWSVRATPLLATPIMMECCICSGPVVTYATEEAWQPRERTQVSLRWGPEPRRKGTGSQAVMENGGIRANLARHHTGRTSSDWSVSSGQPRSAIRDWPARRPMSRSEENLLCVGAWTQRPADRLRCDRLSRMMESVGLWLPAIAFEPVLESEHRRSKPPRLDRWSPSYDLGA